MKFRAVLHVHSNWSYDGQWPLERIARFYGAFGIDAVMMTEHDTGFVPSRFAEYRAACASASTQRCRLIPGIEYSCPENDIHILTWGLTDFLAEHRPIMETLGAVKERGGVAVFAHPVRRAAWRSFQPKWVPLLSAIELWNRKSDGISWSQKASDLIRTHNLPATVGQDFHHLRHAYPLTQLFHLCEKARSIEASDVEAALVAKLIAGDSVPQIFRYPVLDTAGRPRAVPHVQLERLRQTLRDTLKRRRTNPL